VTLNVNTIILNLSNEILLVIVNLERGIFTFFTFSHSSFFIVVGLTIRWRD